MTHACTNQNQLKQEHEALVPVLEVIEGGLNNDGNGRTAFQLVACFVQEIFYRRETLFLSFQKAISIRVFLQWPIYTLFI